MKSVFLISIGLIGAVIGFLWLIGFTTHHIVLFPSSPWQTFGGTIMTGVECTLFAFIGGAVAILSILFFVEFVLSSNYIYEEWL